MSSTAIYSPKYLGLSKYFLLNSKRCNFKSIATSFTFKSTSKFHTRSKSLTLKDRFSTTDLEKKDIVIVGGGVAGLSLACKIGHELSLQNEVLNPPKITVVERFSLPKPMANTEIVHPADSIIYSNRVVSLTPASVGFYSEIDVWSHIDLRKVRPYQNIQVWDAAGGGSLHFEAPKDVGNMAYMVELSNLTSALMSKLSGLKSDTTNQRKFSIEILENTTVSSIHLATQDDLDWPTITLDNKNQLQARLLVGADGGNSPVRLFAGIESIGWDYNQNGIVATVKLDSIGGLVNSNTAWQRFLPTGTLALLPLNENFASIVWSVPSIMTGSIKKLTSFQLTRLLNIALSASPEDVSFLLNQIQNNSFKEEDFDLTWRNQTVTSNLSPSGIPNILTIQEGSVAAFPLKMRHVSNYVKPRIALIGDAAHTIHPLAGQGLNLGIADSKSLGETLVRGLRGGADLGALPLLQNYASERFFPNLVMLGSTDKLNRLFRANDFIVPKIRSLGMDFIDKILPTDLKHKIVRLATRGFA